MKKYYEALLKQLEQDKGRWYSLLKKDDLRNAEVLACNIAKTVREIRSVQKELGIK